MKKILVACGTGMATSTMIASKVKTFLEGEGIECDTAQCILGEIPLNLTGKDLIITSMKVDTDYGVPCITGAAFLTGIGADSIKEEILSILR